MDDEFKAARFCVGINIYDNGTQKDIFNEGQNFATTSGAITSLEKAIEELKKL